MKFDKRFEIIKRSLLIKLLLQLWENSQIENLIHNDFAKPKIFRQLTRKKNIIQVKLLDSKYLFIYNVV